MESIHPKTEEKDYSQFMQALCLTFDDFAIMILLSLNALCVYTAMIFYKKYFKYVWEIEVSVYRLKVIYWPELGSPKSPQWEYFHEISRGRELFWFAEKIGLASEKRRRILPALFGN